MNGIIVFLTISLIVGIVYLILLLFVYGLEVKNSKRYITFITILMILIYLLILYINRYYILNNPYPNYLF